MPDRIRIRNTVARSGIMRKGGAHVKSKSAVRQRAKMSTENGITEWEQSEDEDNDVGEELNSSAFVLTKT